MVRVAQLDGRIRKLERAKNNTFTTTIRFEDGSQEVMNYLDIFDMVFRLNCLPFKEPKERRLTEEDWAWMGKMKHVIPDPREISYALVVNARQIAIEYTACLGIPVRKNYGSS